MNGCFDGIFLDFYGTLVGGDREAVEAICADMATTWNLNCAPEELGCAWGAHFFAQIEQANHEDFCTLFECECRSLRQMMQERGIDVNPMPYVRKLQEYWRNPPLLPGVVEALASWKLPICLVSNVDREDLKAALTRLGLRFDTIVTSEDARSYKPHAGIFRYALAQTGWRAERVLHVGDSLHSDVHGAKRCGLWTAWVDRPGRISDVGTCESHYRIEVLSQLAYVIGGNG